jgi:K+:H+ antiporter
VSSDASAGYVLIDIAVVIALGHLLSPLARRFGQPLVMAEIFAGIALGPSLLGAIAPDVSATLFAPKATEMLAAIGNIGLVLFMFFIGLELDLAATLRDGRTVAFTAFGSMAVPLAGGVLLGISLYESHVTAPQSAVPAAGFVLFIGVAVSITAFPVLARILQELGVASTQLGRTAISTAAVNDLIGWLLLVLALAIAAGDTPALVAARACSIVALSLTLVHAVRPLLRRVLRAAKPGPGPSPSLGLVLALLAASAGATQAVGLHAVIGAFLFGLAFPSELRSEFQAYCRQAFLPITMSLLLPVYFLGPGLSFDLRSLQSGGAGEFALIIAVAFGAKLTGTVTGARYAGMNWSESGLLGVLLNTRGLVELVVLNIGVTEGILDQSLYSEFLLMAILATLLTSPVLRAALRADKTRSAFPTLSRTRPRPQSYGE